MYTDSHTIINNNNNKWEYTNTNMLNKSCFMNIIVQVVR